jgi:hypothetical protein
MDSVVLRLLLYVMTKLLDLLQGRLAKCKDCVD